jgi:hypothetical protein
VLQSNRVCPVVDEPSWGSLLAASAIQDAAPKSRISALRSTFYTRHSSQPSMRIYCELECYKIVKVGFCVWLDPSFTWFVGHFAEDQLDICPKLFVFGKLGDLVHIESFKHQNFRIHPGFFSNRKPDFIVDLASLENHR